jgi:hypothetical protein
MNSKGLAQASCLVVPMHCAHRTACVKRRWLSFMPWSAIALLGSDFARGLPLARSCCKRRWEQGHGALCGKASGGLSDNLGLQHRSLEFICSCHTGLLCWPACLDETLPLLLLLSSYYSASQKCCASLNCFCTHCRRNLPVAVKVLVCADHPPAAPAAPGAPPGGTSPTAGAPGLGGGAPVVGAHRGVMPLERAIMEAGVCVSVVHPNIVATVGDGVVSFGPIACCYSNVM